jgi:hypothetical protein
MVADIDAGKDKSVSPNPNIVADPDGSNSHLAAFLERVIMRIVNRYVVADQAITADLNRFGCYHGNALVQERAVTYSQDCSFPGFDQDRQPTLSPEANLSPQRDVTVVFYNRNIPLNAKAPICLYIHDAQPRFQS